MKKSELNMKKSELKLFIKEVVDTINEMVGEKPEIGQFRWNYEISITIKNADGTTYNRVDTSKWWPIIAETEQEAKEKVIAPYNPKTVTIQKVRMIKGKAIDQNDINQWKELSAGIAHELRPKSQGGWGANESVIKESTQLGASNHSKQAWGVWPGTSVKEAMYGETSSASTTPEQKQFALDISTKLKERIMKKGGDYGMIEAVRQMVEFKLAKEGWSKKTASTVSHDDIAANAYMRGKYG